MTRRQIRAQRKAKQELVTMTCQDERDDDDDRDEWPDPVCERCRGDGMDPWIDYLLPCPDCQGEQRL